MNVNAKDKLFLSNLVKRMNRIVGSLENIFHYKKAGV